MTLYLFHYNGSKSYFTYNTKTQLFFLQAGHLEVKVLLQRKILGILNTMTQK